MKLSLEDDLEDPGGLLYELLDPGFFATLVPVGFAFAPLIF